LRWRRRYCSDQARTTSCARPRRRSRRRRSRCRQQAVRHWPTGSASSRCALSRPPVRRPACGALLTFPCAAGTQTAGRGRSDIAGSKARARVRALGCELSAARRRTAAASCQRVAGAGARQARGSNAARGAGRTAAAGGGHHRSEHLCRRLGRRVADQAQLVHFGAGGHCHAADALTDTGQASAEQLPPRAPATRRTPIPDDARGCFAYGGDDAARSAHAAAARPAGVSSGVSGGADCARRGGGLLAAGRHPTWCGATWITPIAPHPERTQTHTASHARTSVSSCSAMGNICRSKYSQDLVRVCTCPWSLVIAGGSSRKKRPPPPQRVTSDPAVVTPTVRRHHPLCLIALPRTSEHAQCFARDSAP